MTAPPPPTGQQRVRYRYHFTDYMTGRLRATLPVRDAQLETVLRGVGQAQGSIPLYDRAAAAQDVGSATLPRRSCLFAERQVLDAQRRVLTSTIQWGGLVMSRARSLVGRSLAVKAVSFEGYMSNRLVPDTIWTGWDRAWILRWLVATAFGGNPLAGSQFAPDDPQPRGGVTTAPLWNVPRMATAVPDWVTGYLADASVNEGAGAAVSDRTYVGADLKNCLDSAQSLTSADSGMDWAIQPYRDPSGLLTARLRYGYPRVGRVQPPDVVWSTTSGQSRTGYLQEGTVTEDESATPNVVTAVGSGDPPDQLRGIARDYGELTYGYPRFELGLATSSTDDLVTQEAVNAHAAGALAAGKAAAVQVSGIKVRGDLFPYLDRYVLGDDATLRLTDPLTRAGLTIVGQITGRVVNPPQQGSTGELVALDVSGQRAARS